MSEKNPEPQTEQAELTVPEIAEGTNLLELPPEQVKQWLHERRMQGLSPLQEDYSLYMVVLDFDTHRENLIKMGEIDAAVVQKDPETDRFVVVYHQKEGHE